MHVKVIMSSPTNPPITITPSLVARGLLTS